MTTWPHIPDDAVDWFRAVFAEANRRVTERLLNVPNIRETALDDGLIEAIIPYSPPRLLPSGAVVEMNVHNIGGLRRLGPWETADIAVLVFVYRNGALVSQKIGLLQSKRLYPSNNDVDDEDPVGFAYGMNKFLRRDPNSPLGRLHREFEFTADCHYGALKAGSDQVAVIDRLNEEFGDAVYYLLYNPPIIPTRVRYPVVSYQTITQPPLGCRVYAPTDIDAALTGLDDGQTPTFAELEAAGSSSNWRLETWAADLLLRCKVGQQFGEDRQEIVGRLLERRSGPIAAAIAVSIALPEG